MTTAFLTVLRILVVGLLAFWGYRLWTGTASWTSRGLGVAFCGMLVWQVLGGTW